MADSSVARQHVAGGNRVDSILFFIVLILLLIGPSPFRPRDTATSILAQTDGDVLNQIVYAGLFLVTGARFLLGTRPEWLLPLSRWMALLLCWMGLSVLWSLQPELTLRRSTLVAFATLPALFCLSRLGPEEGFSVLRQALTFILLADWASVLLVPNLAIHQPSDYETAIIGDWRGTHYHKNAAGPIMALTGLLQFMDMLAGRKRWSLVLFALATIFLVNTGSKSALGFFGMSLLSGVLYQRFSATRSARGTFVLTLVLVVGVALSLGLPALADLVPRLFDPELFTGRGAVWRVATTFIAGHPVAGAGYLAFWGIGPDSPLRQLGSGWEATAGHSHNGYLELLVGLGGVGLALAIMACFVTPLRRLVADPPLAAHRTLFVWLVYMALQNLLESNILQRLNEPWALHVVLVGLLTMQKRRSN